MSAGLPPDDLPTNEFRSERPRRRERDEHGEPLPRPGGRYPDSGPPQSSGLATTALILGLVSLACSFLAGIPAIICGIISLSRSSAGKGMAIAGIVLGTFSTLAIPVLIGLLLPAVQKVREAAARANDLNSLKSVALGVHDFASNSPDGITLPTAEDDLSWRVQILPYIQQKSLYNQFKMTEPWDSPANRPLAQSRVPAFVSVSDPADTTETRIRVFTGPQTLFPPGKPPTLNARDGLSNTFLAVHAEERVPFSQPKEMPYSPDKPLPAFSKQYPSGFLVTMGDGSTRLVSKSVSPSTLRALITANGNDQPGADW